MAAYTANASPSPPTTSAGPSHAHSVAPNPAPRRSATPPGSNALQQQQQQQNQGPSKRDKRRSAIQEKYHDLTDTFTNSRDLQFRHAVQELQNEMALISSADVYDPAPLSDRPDEVSRRLHELATGKQIAGVSETRPAGRWYSSFVQEINKTKEERDAALVELKNRHRYNLNRIQEDRDFLRQLAIEEHNRLRDTIRERLVQTISSRKSRLMKDKEHLDIADTSALLLHPNQFSITNPASPGGVHGNRKTRHTRRGAEFEDLGGGGGGGGSGGVGAEANKRKRKAPLDDEYGSPPREVGQATPADHRTKARATQQQTAPSYSILSLFTEKELAMHSNSAHVAAVHFLAASKRAKNTAAASTTAMGTNLDDQEDTSGDAEGSSAQEDGGGGGGGGGGVGAADMERTTSQNLHATRSTRTNGGTAGLNLLGELAEKNATRPNLPYFILSNYHSRPNGTVTAPSPASLLHDEIDEDLNKFDRLEEKPNNWVDDRLLKNLVQSMRDVEEGVPVADHQRFSNLHPDFPPHMDVRMARADLKRM